MAELIKRFDLLSMMHIYDISSRANCSPGTSSTFSHVLKKCLNYDLCLSSQDFENMAMFKKKNNNTVIAFC